MKRFLHLLERFDWILLTAALTLAALGLIAIYGIGISQEQENLFTFYKQFVGVAIGITGVFTLVFVDYRYLRSFGFIAYLCGIGLLILVLVLGHTINGTQGWFRLGGLSFQPVELAKITLAIYLAALFSRLSHGQLSWRNFALSGCATFIYVGLVMLQPDFGSAMVLIAIWGIMAMFAGLPKWAWIIIPVVAVLMGGALWSFGLKPYQRDRVISFLNPELDPRGTGYNAAQALIAIGSGGWFGKGIGEGSQARLRFLPEAATDFIFAVLGEELGFVGLTIVLALFIVIIYRYLRIAYDSEDDFASLLLVGLGSIFVIHVVVNAGMNLGVMPITGIPMPFISAAASYLVVAFMSVGLAESVASRRLQR